MLDQNKDPGRLGDIVAATVDLSPDERASLLVESDVAERLRRLLVLLQRKVELIKVKQKIDLQVREEFSKHQREAVLRQKLKAIQDELGEGEDASDLDAFDEKIKAAEMPADVEKTARKQLERLKQMAQSSAEYTVQRTYLEWMAELPWSKRAEDRLDLDQARDKLDADHYGLDDVKKRILEHIAVLKLSGNAHGTILCLVGPARRRQDLARTVDRRRDRPTVRAHRRSAACATRPRSAVTAAPTSARCRVASSHALEEGQGRRTRCSCSTRSTSWAQGWARLARGGAARGARSGAEQDVHRPLPRAAVRPVGGDVHLHREHARDAVGAAARSARDHRAQRLHARREARTSPSSHLVPKRSREHGIAEGALTITDAALRAIVLDYTREAGVRQLDREITRALPRARARGRARHRRRRRTGTTVDLADVGEVPRQAAASSARSPSARAVPGVATGLAWTPVGGDILFIETSRMPGKGRLEITGQLGDVMKESARAALSSVRTRVEDLSIAIDFEKTDIHLHVPQSPLAGDLVARGFTDVTALDIVAEGLARARARLGSAADRVHWVQADLRSWTPRRQFDVWHDRAVFHFLTEPVDQARYRAALDTALASDGRLVIATFAADGPDHCSGLPTARYSPEGLLSALGKTGGT